MICHSSASPARRALPAGTLPIGRLAVMRLIVTPGTLLRWHRDIVRRRWARRSRQGKAGGGPGQRRKDHQVSPVRPGPGSLTPKHRDLMTEHHDLRIFGRLAAAQQHRPTKTRTMIR